LFITLDQVCGLARKHWTNKQLQIALLIIHIHGYT